MKFLSNQKPPQISATKNHHGDWKAPPPLDRWDQHGKVVCASWRGGSCFATWPAGWISPWWWLALVVTDLRREPRRGSLLGGGWPRWLQIWEKSRGSPWWWLASLTGGGGGKLSEKRKKKMPRRGSLLGGGCWEKKIFFFGELGYIKKFLCWWFQECSSIFLSFLFIIIIFFGNQEFLIKIIFIKKSSVTLTVTLLFLFQYLKIPTDIFSNGHIFPTVIFF